MMTTSYIFTLLVGTARHFRTTRARNGHELPQLLTAFTRSGALDAVEAKCIHDLIEEGNLVVLAAYEAFAVDLDAEELIDTFKMLARQVRVIFIFHSINMTEYIIYLM
jgi:hypothetical protein